MNATLRLGWTLLTLTALAPCAWSQGNSETIPPELSRPDACRLEVAKFEQTIGFIRQTQGNKAAAELKEKLIPTQLANDLLLTEGYCGLARHIRDKKLNK
jgi:hypothetical protein